MAGFRSPLFVLGIGTTSANIGFRSPIPFPGISTTEPAANEVAFLTPIPIWNMGATPFVPVEQRRGGTGYGRILQDDEEILAVIMAYMKTR